MTTIPASSQEPEDVSALSTLEILDRLEITDGASLVIQC